MKHLRLFEMNAIKNSISNMMQVRDAMFFSKIYVCELVFVNVAGVSLLGHGMKFQERFRCFYYFSEREFIQANKVLRFRDDFKRIQNEFCKLAK